MEQGGRVVTFDYPVWMNVIPDTFDQEDIVTGNLGNLGFGTPGYLEPAEGAATTFTPLVTTTPRAAQFTTAQVAAVTTDPRDLLDEYTPQDPCYTLVARVSGKVRTAFPEGRPLPDPARRGGRGRRRPDRDDRGGRGGRSRGGPGSRAPLRVHRGRPDHPHRGRRHARGSVLGGGGGVPRQPDRDAERGERIVREQRDRQPYRLRRPHQRAQSRHVHPALHPGGRAQAAGRTRLSHEGAGADRANSRRPSAGLWSSKRATRATTA